MLIFCAAYLGLIPELIYFTGVKGGPKLIEKNHLR